MIPAPSVTPAVQRLLVAAYNAYNQRDVDGGLKYLHPDVRLPSGSAGGIVRGHRDVRAHWKKQWQSVHARAVPISFSLLADGRAALDVHEVIKDLEGNLLADHLVRHIYKIENGKIRTMEIGNAI